MKVFYTLFSLFFFSIQLHAQLVVQDFRQVGGRGTIGVRQVPKYELFEVEIKLSQAQFSNPFDPEEVDVVVEYIHSNTGTRITMPAFWYQNFQRCIGCPDPTAGGFPDKHAEDPDYLTPVATPYSFRARIAFKEQGNWQYRVVVRHNQGLPYYSTYKTISVSAPVGKGFVKVGSNKRSFAFEDGTPYMPIGMNYVTHGTTQNYNRLNYNEHMDGILKTADHGGNMLRIWMDALHFGVEWGENNIGNYSARMNRAFDLDAIIEYAHDRDLYFLLTLDAGANFGYEQHNGVYTGRWLENPYRAVVGEQAQRRTFFSNEQCKEMYKRRLRYIMSRWGYSQNIMAWEMWNEVENVDHYFGFWKEVRSWHKEMIRYSETIDPNHLYTTSFASPRNGIRAANEYPTVQGGLAHAAANGVNSLEEIDIINEHNYSQDYNVEHQRHYLAQRARHLFPDKPYLIGEVGYLFKPCEIRSEAFTPHSKYNPNVNKKLRYHDHIEIHNTLWSSVMSGMSSTAMYFWTNKVYARSSGGMYANYKPLQMFLENETTFANEYKAIVNNVKGKGIKDQRNCGVALYEDPIQGYPEELACLEGIDESYLNRDIQTTNDEELEVFALRGEEKTIGWIHSKRNYWYNLPHKVSAACEGDWDDNQPVTPEAVSSLENEVITINGLPCDGTYKIEFYSTYPAYDINGDSIEEFGGVISDFTIEEVEATCGALRFTCPDLKALGVAPPYAPDYGFKITKTLSKSWEHQIITPAFDKKINGGLAINDQYTHLFYKDNQDQLVVANLEEQGDWVSENLTAANGGDPHKIKGALAYDKTFGPSEVFFEGEDNTLCRFYYQDGSWNFEATSFPKIFGDIAFNDGKVFYESVDHELCQLFRLEGVWTLVRMKESNGSFAKVYGGIVNVDGLLFYRGQDGALHHMKWNGTSWEHSILTPVGIQVYSNLVLTQDGQEVYYKGVDGKLHKYSWIEASQVWLHSVVDFPDFVYRIDGDIALSKSGHNIFFREASGYVMHVYKQGLGYGYDFMFCEEALFPAIKSKTHLVCSDNMVFYEGVDSRVHQFKYGNECIPTLDPIEEQEQNIDGDNTNDSTDLKGFLGAFPNPFDQQLNVVVDPSVGEGTFYVEIINSFGSNIYSSTLLIPGQLFTINTTAFEKGVYYLSLYRGNELVESEVILKY